MLRTEFWLRAAASLPPQARIRHILELERAERLDLAMSELLDWLKRVYRLGRPRGRSRVEAARLAGP
jgi:hypothetical protein